MGFYQDKLGANGAAQRAGWRSEIERYFRFEWILHVIETSGFTTLSILDIGCADGALICSLSDRQKPNYIGVEILPHFLEQARAEHGDITFLEGDFRDLLLPASDLVVALGTTVGEHGSVALTEIYEAAYRSGAELIALSSVAGKSADSALVPFPPPPVVSGWIRTFCPAISGEHIWVDARRKIPETDAQTLFDRAKTRCGESPGSAAMLAARLGLTLVVEAFANAHPHDDHVQLAVEWLNLTNLKH